MDINSKEFLEKITAVKPSKRQLDWQKLGYYNFIHYGMNTYTGKEWGNGVTPASEFNPTNLDTDQWVRALARSGSKGVIITAKHHDGFCLFPSKYTDYTVANSPYKNGKGDIVKELSESCKKYNFKFGIYLSPWDMHEPTYGTDGYNDFYCKQLEELLTNYGDLFSLWFDGACGEGPNGKKQEYDFNRYYDLIRKHQPNASITICGPDVRWIGNESGKCRQSEWSVVSSAFSEYNLINESSQQEDNGKFMKKEFNAMDNDLGSRNAIANVKDLIWYPAEMDVSITKHGWFYHKKNEIICTRSVKNLMNLYVSSVGNNATLLLNVPVNKAGVITAKFAKRLASFGDEINSQFGTPIMPTVENSIYNEEFVYNLKFDLAKISKIELAEDITKSQRVESFQIYAFEKNQYKLIYSGTTIGFRKICLLKNKTEISNIKIVITKSRLEPYITGIKLYK